MVISCKDHTGSFESFILTFKFNDICVIIFIFFSKKGNFHFSLNIYTQALCFFDKLLANSTHSFFWKACCTF